MWPSSIVVDILLHLKAVSICLSGVVCTPSVDDSVAGRSYGAQCHSPIPQEVRDHPPLQAYIIGWSLCFLFQRQLDEGVAIFNKW